MNPITNPDLSRLLPALAKMPPEYQAIVTSIAMEGPISAPDIAERVGKSRSWIADHIYRVRNMLGGIAKIEAYRGRSGGYVLRMVDAAKPDPREQVTMQSSGRVSTVATEPEKPDTFTLRDDESITPAEPSPPRRKKLFVFPWSGGVMLSQIASVNSEGGRVVVQLKAGGFMRGPIRTDADHVASELLTELSRLEYIQPIVYGQSA